MARFVGTTNIITGTLRNLDTEPEIEIPDLGRFKIDLPQKQKKEWMAEGCES